VRLDLRRQDRAAARADEIRVSHQPVEEHRRRGAGSVRCLVVTVSDTRRPANDASGARAAEMLASAGHEVRERVIVPDEAAEIGARVRAAIADPEIDAVVLTGGTGVAPRDVTTETIEALLQKRLDGFGEIFRMLSFAEVGGAAMLSRAVAGIAGSTAIFALPGSTKAVELAMAKLVVPELGHLIGLLRP
jgi:molybdenum cofactor biosynthesis protein B